jgi:hypothetical protein
MFANAGIKGPGVGGRGDKHDFEKWAPDSQAVPVRSAAVFAFHHEAAIARNAADGQHQEYAERPIGTRPANPEIGTRTGVRSCLENLQFGQDIAEENLGTFETSIRARKRAQTYLRRKRLEAKAYLSCKTT